jgi:hypothetical protein
MKIRHLAFDIHGRSKFGKKGNPAIYMRLSRRPEPLQAGRLTARAMHAFFWTGKLLAYECIII